LYLLYFRLGKGLLSQDFYFVSGIINYNFGLSVFIFPKSGVKIGQFVILRYDKISFVRGNAGNSKQENLAKLQCKKCAKSVRARNPPNNQASVEKQ
jgi:hypothetical protein